jgi:hypothetical protein
MVIGVKKGSRSGTKMSLTEQKNIIFLMMAAELGMENLMEYKVLSHCGGIRFHRSQQESSTATLLINWAIMGIKMDLSTHSNTTFKK